MLLSTRWFPPAERPRSAAGPAAMASNLGKPECRPRLLQRLVRRSRPGPRAALPSGLVILRLLAPPGPYSGPGGRARATRLPPTGWTRQPRAQPPRAPAGRPPAPRARLRPRASPGRVAAPPLAQDAPEADGQLGPPVGRVQARLTQEREQVAPVSPQVLGQALVSRVRLGREDQA